MARRDAFFPTAFMGPTVRRDRELAAGVTGTVSTPSLMMPTLTADGARKVGESTSRAAASSRADLETDCSAVRIRLQARG